jgi:nitrite reductase (NO-forming)
VDPAELTWCADAAAARPAVGPPTSGLPALPAGTASSNYQYRADIYGRVRRSTTMSTTLTPPPVRQSPPADLPPRRPPAPPEQPPTSGGRAVALLIAAVGFSVGASLVAVSGSSTGGTVVAAEPEAVEAVVSGPRSAEAIGADPAGLPGPIGTRGPTTVQLELETRELEGQLADGTTYTYWTFDGTVPGPMLRVREGDTVELTLTNAEDSGAAHSIDLHAVNGPGGGAGATQVVPGDGASFTFQALNPGVYVYHCATPHIPTHVANGMYGLIVVEPEGGFEPVDREFYVVQGEIYTAQERGTDGQLSFDPDALFDEAPSHVVFNGQAAGMTGDGAMQAEVGETVRVFVGNGGPNLTSSFHVIGEVFDRASVEGGTLVNTDVQTTTIPAGGATWVEFTLDVPGDYLLVDHALSRAIDGGAVAAIHATGPDDPTVFDAPQGSESGH